MLDFFETVMDRLDDIYLRKQQTDQDIERQRREREAAKNSNRRKIR